MFDVCRISFLLELTDSAPCVITVPGRVIKPSGLPLSITLAVLDNQVWEPFSVKPRWLTPHSIRIAVRQPRGPACFHPVCGSDRR